MTDKDEKKPLKIVFAEGCFDNFEGTQEELDELVAEITKAFTSGDFLDKMTPLEDLPEEEIEEFLEHMAAKDGPRTLQ